MSGLWNQAGVPHRGWVCVYMEDLEEAIHTCEMCGKEEIRYVHGMEHPEYAEPLRVGCVCAEKMADDYTGARERERRMKNRAARRRTWTTRKWRHSKKTGIFSLKVDGYTFTTQRVGPLRSKWRGDVRRPDGTWKYGKKLFDRVEDLERALFDWVWPARESIARSPRADRSAELKRSA